MRELLLSTTVLASFLGGMVALFAPCCVSVMLPAYLASAFRRRSRMLAMTLVFAAGVASVILPVALGATALTRLFVEQHTWIYALAGAVMVAGGVAVLAGWTPRLPMPGMRTPASPGVASVFGLGAFSGVASACCAPVLVGVVAASGAVSSFPAALAVGVAYVFGMVAPLAALAAVWDRRRWDAAGLVNRRITLRLWRWRRQSTLATVAAGGLLAVIGLLTLGLAAAGPGMTPGGWQARLARWLDHARAVILDALGWLPGWASAGLVFTALVAVLVLAWRHRHVPAGAREGGLPHDLVGVAEPARAAAAEPAAGSPAIVTDVESNR